MTLGHGPTVWMRPVPGATVLGCCSGRLVCELDSKTKRLAERKKKKRKKERSLTLTRKLMFPFLGVFPFAIQNHTVQLRFRNHCLSIIINIIMHCNVKLKLKLAVHVRRLN